MRWSVKNPAKTASTGVDVSDGEVEQISPEMDHKVDDTTALDEVKAFERAHEYDPNLPDEAIDAIHEATKTADPERVRQVDGEITESSPYESVRAAVRDTDDPSLPANTLRAWILGFIFVTFSAGVNMFLSMRSPAISIPTVVILLIVYPVGQLWAKIMPTRKFTTFGVTWTLNPGEFNIKEHSVVTLMASVTSGYAYSTDALIALKGQPFYGLNMGWGFQLLFTISSQLIGIALSGIFRRFLIWPSSMVWPVNFSITTLLYALHDKSPTDPAISNGWRISRYRFFVYLTLGAFAWYWFPGVIFQGLSVFAFPTWIAPNNVVVNQLFGGFTGLSLLPLTFDWTYVSAYLANPLLAPTFAHLNTMVGLICFVILGTIGITYTGAIYSDYLPMSTNRTFDNTQHKYQVKKILGPGYTFDPEAYKNYSPLFLAPTFILNYGLNFAASTASIVHTILYHRQEVWARFKLGRQQEPNDIHMRLMKRYREAPDWWYVTLAVVSIGLGLVAVLCFHHESQMPWWAYFVSILVAVVFVIPICMIYAMANIQLSLNVISPFIAGWIIPGRPIAVMVFKVYSTILLGQAQTFGSNLKLAHYMKVPPRITFTCQMAMTVWASIVQIAVMNYVFGSIDNVCAPDQKSNFTCPNGASFFASSIVWGLIGPRRFLGPGSIYVHFNYFWLLGALLPVLFYVITRVFPNRRLRFLHAPVMLGAMQWLPPATPLSFSSWAIVGFVFNWGIRRRFNGWWKNFNYITAAALDSGLIIATMVIFFAITLPNVNGPQWWGNVNVFETKDYLFTAFRKTVAPGETFGPATWVV
ncbi:OPT family small oligopeptide transporter [Acrodontium crateriforme]|uniref:OPT family small oligopeptide transporter n=1 Tax=Acrodontium crateriforme TaxID=150365 RepID=A0AAQ3RAY2_9PEZI|nr:OPT family small oligopeptide transporter [Acrodontium crateriforme]